MELRGIEMTKEQAKQIVKGIIYQFISDYDGDEEIELTKEDRLLLEVNKTICNTIDSLEELSSDDCVSRQAVKTAIYSHCYGTEDGLYFEGNVEHIINELPKVVSIHGTCKDCRHREGIDLDACFCAKHGNSARDDFYCADFEKQINIE